MGNEQTTVVFGEDRASVYDSQSSGPVRDALQYLVRSVLADLPENARVLCVGVGTGLELLDLAKAFPKWTFTAVEPAAAMMAHCRRRVEEAGVEARCTFHEGFLETLPESEPFDGATCLLVSHFFLQLEDRKNFLSLIARRLKVGGRLVSSDLVSDMSSAKFPRLMKAWRQMLRYQGLSEEQIDSFCNHYGTNVAVLPPVQVENLIAGSGFSTPTLFHQALFIHAWFADRAA
jgi:tRNA (cmo5U34)-methyltransferase